VRAVVVLSVVLAGAAVGAALWPRDSNPAPDPCGATQATPAQAGLAAAAQATLCLLNRERASRGLAPLRENGLLSAASVAHSRDMVTGAYFEHTAADGRTVQDRLRAIGYVRGRSASTGENIAYGVGVKSSPAAIVRLWMNSAGHREDILRPAFTEIGIGIALGAPGVDASKQADSATYTTDFGGAFDPSLPSG
jgi:uncharacterized protein YkwD